MGVFRLCLALGVIFHHSGGWPYVISGGLAVELFFIISGFYMALILDSKYASRPTLFWSNRLLRLAPTYILAIVVQLILLLGWDLAKDISRADFLAYSVPNSPMKVLLLLSNAIALFQEVFIFFSVNSAGDLYWDPSQLGSFPAYKLMLASQAWSISIELMFYFLAPFLRRRLYLIVSLFVLSYVLHKCLVFSDLSFNTWGRHLFPAILHFFLMGMLGYYLSQRWAQRLKSISPLVAYFGAGVILLLAYKMRVVTPIVREFGFPTLALMTALWVPVMFYSTKSTWDRLLGELSYPVYMLHMIVLGILVKGTALKGGWLNACAAVATLAFSWTVYWFIDRKVDDWRQRRAARAAAAVPVSVVLPEPGVSPDPTG